MINFNQHYGLSWQQWVKIPNNKMLFEQNPIKAKARYMEEEAEYIENVMLQERIRLDSVERQRTLAQQLRSITEVADDSNVAAVGGVSAPGGAAGSGGGYNVLEGIGSYAVGTYLTFDLIPADVAHDEGPYRFTVL